jgi:hypothetical protein
MAWAGLRHGIKTKVRSLISSGKDRIDTLDQLFDCAAASDFKPDDKQPGGQQQQERQTGESQTGGDKKRNFGPSISEPTDNTSGNSNASCNSKNSGTGNSRSGKSNKSSRGSRTNISPALWLSKEIYESQKANRQCTRCGSGDHKPTFVPNTSVSNGSNPLERFLVRVGTGTEPWQRFLTHENPDCCHWAGFTTKNPAFEPHNFGSN